MIVSPAIDMYEEVRIMVAQQPRFVMSQRRTALPTEAELEILQVLWQRGEGTVREVQEVLKESRGTGYTTALKQLQIMHRKGLVGRNDRQRSHVYSAAVGEEETQRRMVGKLLHRAFEGSSGRLVLHALAEETPSPEELAEIRELLNRMEAEGKE